MNIAIMRAFVELRRVASSHGALQERLEELERETAVRFGRHDRKGISSSRRCGN